MLIVLSEVDPVLIAVTEMVFEISFVLNVSVISLLKPVGEGDRGDVAELIFGGRIRTYT